MEAKKYWVIAVAIVAAFVVGRWSANESPAAAKAKTEREWTAKIEQVEQTDVTVQQLQQIVESRRLTELQKQEAVRDYIGKQVQWKGSLKSASLTDGRLCAVISHTIKPSWLLGRRHVRATIEFDDSQKEMLLNAQEGSLVTFRATLKEFTSSAKKPCLLTDGQVLRVEAAPPKVGTKSTAAKG
jgi:hypothetical protein